MSRQFQNPPNPTGKGLIPPVKGERRNPNGRPKGSLNMSTRIKEIMSRNIDWDRMNVKQADNLKKRYGDVAYGEAMIYIQISKAMTGDTRAFDALREAGWGRTVNLGGDAQIEVVHIYKPEKLAIAQIEQASEQLRARALRAIEGEVINEVDGTTRTPDIRPINP